jgi:hypothetical protein
VVVLVDGEDELAGPLRVVAVPAPPFEEIPAVVLETGTAPRRDVDLLDLSLPDVADVEVPGRAVEREAPGIAQAEPDDRPTRRARRAVEAEELPER